MLKVLKSGLFTTIQDLGRFGYLNKGVPVSGVMDVDAALSCNTLLENHPNDALMEITMTGPVLEFTKDTYVALTGAKMSPKINSNLMENNKVYKIHAGDVLSFGKLEEGVRAYLGVKKGFQTSKVLASRSFYSPITKEKRIAVNTSISYTECLDYAFKTSAFEKQGVVAENIVNVTKGPEFHLLQKEHLEVLFFKEFSVAKENDRMAYQIHEKIPPLHYSMLTSATLPGTVQITPSGTLIILMKDGQTTGGYPRVLQLTKDAIGVIAQKKFKDNVFFKLVEVI